MGLLLYNIWSVKVVLHVCKVVPAHLSTWKKFFKSFSSHKTAGFKVGHISRTLAIGLEKSFSRIHLKDCFCILKANYNTQNVKRENQKMYWATASKTLNVQAITIMHMEFFLTQLKLVVLRHKTFIPKRAPKILAFKHSYFFFMSNINPSTPNPVMMFTLSVKRNKNFWRA